MAQVCNPSALDVEEAEVEARKIKKIQGHSLLVPGQPWLLQALNRNTQTNKGWSLSKVGHVVFVK